MGNRWVRLAKLFWLPLLLIIMIALEPYLGVWQSEYWIEYLAFQILLLVIYAYILYMDSRKTKAKMLSAKGRRRSRK